MCVDICIAHGYRGVTTKTEGIVKIYGVWHGGPSYYATYPTDLEVFPYRLTFGPRGGIRRKRF